MSRIGKLPQRKSFGYFFSPQSGFSFEDVTHAEHTPFNPFTQPLKKWCRQASLPQREHFLPLSSLNFAPHNAQVKGTMLIDKILIVVLSSNPLASSSTPLDPSRRWSGVFHGAGAKWVGPQSPH